jgi:ribonucleoside-diphosphate reductase beta chain
MSKTITYKIGKKKFILDKEQSRLVQESKKVINGRDMDTFDLLPLKYPWAYDLYKNMSRNHWEPEDIPMQVDIEQWKSVGKHITDTDRWIIRMGLGFFSAAEGMVGTNVLENIRTHITSPELKLALGRQAHEENIHADSLVYMISSLGIDPHEVHAQFLNVSTVKKKLDWIRDVTSSLNISMDMHDPINQKALAQNIFGMGLLFEGMQFYALFGMILSLYRQNKFPGIGTMFRYTLRDESNHIELCRKLFLELLGENPGIQEDPNFNSELYEMTQEAIDFEFGFIDDCLPLSGLGLNADDYKSYIVYIADRRLESVGLTPLKKHGGHMAENRLDWLAEMMDIKKEQNFFEGRVTEYQKASALSGYRDDEL